MMCAVTIRQLKPGMFDEFRKVWEPDPWLPLLRNALVFRNEDNPDQVLTIGFFEADQDKMDELRDDPAVLTSEDQRLHRISEFEERVLINGIFELVEEVKAPAER